MADPTLTFHEDPAAFLAQARDHLAADPVLSTVVATAAARSAADDAEGIAPDPPLPHRWWVVVRAGADVVGVAMRTAPFEPYPLFVLPMPDAGARALARAVVERGEQVLGVNGARPAADTCAGELARLTGGEVVVGLHTRLHRLDQVVPPAPATGSPRPADAAEVDLVEEWFGAFATAADEQAGRRPGSMHRVHPSRDGLLRRIARQEVWLWVAPDGTPVHLSAFQPPAHGAARIAPVYTPPAHRGHGYAASTVAVLAQRILDACAVPCLFTDQANPTSVALYARLGFRPVVDMVDLVVAPGDS